MPRLGAKQTLKVYSLVLFWSVFVAWAGFSLGTREETSEQGLDRVHHPFSRPVSSSYRGVSGPPLVNAEPELNPVSSETSGDSREARKEKFFMVAADPAFHTVQIGAVRTEAEGRQLV